MWKKIIYLFTPTRNNVCTVFRNGRRKKMKIPSRNSIIVVKIVKNVWTFPTCTGSVYLIFLIDSEVKSELKLRKWDIPKIENIYLSNFHFHYVQFQSRRNSINFCLRSLANIANCNWTFEESRTKYDFKWEEHVGIIESENISELNENCVRSPT